MGGPQGFEDVRFEVERDVVADKVKRLTAANDRFLRDRADIRIAAPSR